MLVVVGHCIQYGSGEAYAAGTFFGNPVFKFIYSFHMPLFMLISGYLFSGSLERTDWRELLLRKVRQLLVPLFCWSVLMLCISIGKRLLGLSPEPIGLSWAVRKLASEFLYGPWFLWAIWWCSLAVILIKTHLRDSIAFYLLCCALTFVIPDSLNLGLYKYMWPFFLLGHLFRARSWQSKWQMLYRNKMFILLIFLMFGLLLCFYDYDSYIYTSGYTILGKPVLAQISIDFYRFAVGLTGSIAAMYAIYALQKVLNESHKALLAHIGQNTLGIYLVSSQLLNPLLSAVTRNLSGPNLFYILIESLVILWVSLLLTGILTRFKWTNRLLLGGR